MFSTSKMRSGLGFSALLALFLLAGLTNSQENEDIINDDSILAERVKRDVVGDGDVTTVLLVDNQKLNRDINSRNGRYLNVKPVIGLLTSTARTFIQDGVTTEYATEVVGTTLDNGRVYAQLLTKSSLVLYDKPSEYAQDSVRKTRLPYEVEAKRWNVDENIGESQFVIKNTDYVSPKDGAFTVFASNPSREYQTKVWSPTSSPPESQESEAETEPSKAQIIKEIPKYSEFETFNFLDPIPAARERKISSFNNANVQITDDKSNAKKDIIADVDNKSKIEPAKVKPSINLPTFTVKNEFSPIFYYIDNVESKTEKSSSIPNYLKNAKKLFGHKDDYKPSKTFTYFGFADFTTTVGDTVIIFSPSTANSFVKEDEVTPSAKSEVQPNVVTKIKTYLSSDFGMVTKTMSGHQLNMETAVPTVVMQPDPARSSKALSQHLASLKNVLFEKPMPDEEQALSDEKEKFNRVIASLKSGLFIRPATQFGLHKDSIQPSEASYSTINRIHATEKLHPYEETLRERKVPKIQATEPLGILKSSSIITETTPKKQEVEETTEELSTTESDDVTEEDDIGTTTESYGETIESTDDTLSTPQMDDPEDVVEDSNKDGDSGAVTCTNGIIPVSTMTTAYKTLTFLTTYFLPLEGTETTTSVKSREVVSTETGYITNLACKSAVIDPTSTIRLDIESTTAANIADIIESIVTEASLPVLTTTEKELKEEITTEKVLEETTPEKITTEIPTTVEEKEETKVPDTTTEHLVSTSESHVEISVTTESTIENRYNDETTTEKEQIVTTPTSEENEVDLIFKTFYTTYTYFTTFFQGDTSTISSKKSVVTNVITSTLDISEIDPSIFNAIESSDYLFKATRKEELGQIVPTSVGAGRPTQTYALNSVIDLVRNRQVIDSVENDAIINSRIPTPELSDESLNDDIKPDIVKTYYTTYTFFTTLYVGEDINICSRSEIYTNYVGPASLVPSKTTSSVILNTKQHEIDFNKCKRIPAVKKSTTPEITTEEQKVTTENIPVNKPKQVYTSIDRSNKKETLKTDASNDNVSKNTFQDIVLEKGDSMFVTDVKSSYSKGDRQIIDNAILDDQISSESNIDEIVPSSTLLLQTSYTTFTYFTTMYLGKDSTKVKSRLETVTNVVTETLDPKTIENDETNLPITYYTTFTYWTTLYKDKTTTITSREDTISNVVTPTISPSTVNPIDTQPIEVATVKAPEVKDLEIMPSVPVLDDILTDDGKATFYTTYTYFTTFYVGNSSELRSRLETETNIVDNTKDLVNENQIGRAVGKDSPANNLVDDGEKPIIKSTLLDNVIVPTKVIGDNAIIPTQIVGSYAENNVDKPEKKILSSQVAVISGDSTIITNNDDVKKNEVASTVVPSPNIDSRFATISPSVVEGSVTEPTTPANEEEEDDEIKRKKSRLRFPTKKNTFTPAIVPLFSSRSRPSFSPKRIALSSGVTTITRSDFTPTITATPALKSTKASGFGNRNRGASSAYSGSSSNGGRRFSRISSTATFNSPSQRSTGFGRGRSTASDIQPSSSRRGGFRTSSIRASVSESRASPPRVRPTLSSRFRGNARQTTTPFTSEDASTFVTDSPITSTNEAETAAQTNESENRRTTNSLLRFRRPPFTRAPTTPRTTTQASASNRNRNANRRGGTTTTPKPAPRTTTLNPLFALRNRQRPNSLFPPRGLINKQPEPKPEEETNAAQDVENEETLQEGDEEFNDDTEYESSNQESEVSVASPSPAPARISNVPNIRPFGFRRRSKRQVDYGYRKNFPNFRRQPARTSKPEPKIDIEEEIEEVTSARSRPQSRYSGRVSNYQNTQKPTRGPRGTTAPTAAIRQQFILRGESTTHKPAFRSRTSRPASRSSVKPTVNARPSAPRLKTYTTPQADTSRTRGTTRSRGRGRTTSRYRTTSNDIIDNNYIYQTPNDGKLTVTHKIPTEVTIPVVNGKVTEYKNVLTAKPSLETLLPNQYSTTQNAFGSQYIVLVSESSEPAENGATRVIQFILHESPTTSVIFTPTTIRGRKTSFSHIVPSTVYDVERVTSTIQPQINPNVPLANILLSQLLLGNIAMPQPQINPLLALQGGQQIPIPVPGTPTTEFKTRTTTYVTTVTDAKSTVLPLTFRGKEILTTIVDSKVDVITATEFITDTIVVTPTVAAPQQNPQLNSILLLLQQQQQLQQPIQQQTVNPLLGLTSDLDILQKALPISNDLLNSPKPEVLVLNDEPEDLNLDYVDEITKPLPKKKEEKRKPIINKPIPPRQSSIITLYVSGRHPGEFSTVLSTVYVDETQSIQKREALYYQEVDVNPSALPPLNDYLFGSQSDLMLDTFVMPAMDNSISQDTTSQYETQSLESILGEISKFMNLDSPSTIVETQNNSPTVRYVLSESKIESDR